MKTNARSRYLPLSIFTLTLAPGLAAYGCSTTAVNSTPDSGGGGSSSSSGGSSSSGSGSSGGTSSSSSSGSGSSSGSSSSGTADGGPVACTAKVPASDGGPFLISDFSTVATGMTGDSGVQYNTAFGQYPGYFGGTYFFPSDPTGGVAGPGLPGTDQLPNEAGVGCALPLSHNSFLAQVTPSSKSWVWSGTVAGFSGAGFYIQSAPNLCVDASAYTGVEFTISGTIGNATDAGADAGTSLISFKAFQAEDEAPGTTGTVGTCTTTPCTPPSLSFALPATPTTMTIRWTDLMGGAPDALFNDPAHLTGFEWDLPWPCTGGTPYPINIVIQNVQFITN